MNYGEDWFDAYNRSKFEADEGSTSYAGGAGKHALLGALAGAGGMLAVESMLDENPFDLESFAKVGILTLVGAAVGYGILTARKRAYSEGAEQTADNMTLGTKPATI